MLDNNQQAEETRQSIAEELAEYYSPKVLASKLFCSTVWIEILCQQGRIKAIKFGKLWRIPKSEGDRILAQGLPLPPKEPKPTEVQEILVGEEQAQYLKKKERWWEKEFKIF